ncbi:MAG: ribosome assembly RNA-binding protein YhbY [Myxococcales bacterium]
MSLTGKQRRFLRAEAHALNPVVMVGKEGLSETVLEAVKDALLAHELIKVRLLDTAPLERQELADRLPNMVKAELAGLIGRVVVLYKRHPHKPKIELPRDP